MRARVHPNKLNSNYGTPRTIQRCGVVGQQDEERIVISKSWSLTRFERQHGANTCILMRMTDFRHAQSSTISQQTATASVIWRSPLDRRSETLRTVQPPRVVSCIKGKRPSSVVILLLAFGPSSIRNLANKVERCLKSSNNVLRKQTFDYSPISRTNCR